MKKQSKKVFHKLEVVNCYYFKIIFNTFVIRSQWIFKLVQFSRVQHWNSVWPMQARFSQKLDSSAIRKVWLIRKQVLKDEKTLQPKLNWLGREEARYNPTQDIFIQKYGDEPAVSGQSQQNENRTPQTYRNNREKRQRNRSSECWNRKESEARSKAECEFQ